MYHRICEHRMDFAAKAMQQHVLVDKLSVKIHLAVLIVVLELPLKKHV